MNDPTDAGSRPTPPRSRRPLGALVGVALVTVLVLVVLDRAACVVASRRLAATIQSAQRLQDRPRVQIHGFPFVTQVLHGRYDDVGVQADGPITARGITIDDASVRLREVRVTLHDVVRGTVSDVPVRRGTGSAVVPYASLTAALRRYGGPIGSSLQVRGAGSDQARLQGPLGLGVTATAKVEGGRLRVVPRRDDVSSLPDPVRATVTAILAAPLPLPAFPFHVRLAGGAFGPEGLRLSATSHDSVFPVR